MSIILHGHEYTIGGYDVQYFEVEGCEVINEPAVWTAIIKRDTHNKKWYTKTTWG